jgi:hypothetical protein
LSHYGKQHFVKLFRILSVADSATQRCPRGGFHHAATKITAGAPIPEICLQAKKTTTKLENLKFPNKNEFILKNRYAPCRVEMCEQGNEIIKQASKSLETIPLSHYLLV